PGILARLLEVELAGFVGNSGAALAGARGGIGGQEADDGQGRRDPVDRNGALDPEASRLRRTTRHHRGEEDEGACVVGHGYGPPEAKRVAGLRVAGRRHPRGQEITESVPTWSVFLVNFA